MAGFGSFRQAARAFFGAVMLAVCALDAPALAQPAMWVVKDADSTIYLLGTIHVLKPDTRWHTDKLDAAIAQSDTLWQELPTSDPMAIGMELLPLIMQHGYSQDTKLTDLLTPAEMKSLDEAAKLTGIPGMSGVALNRMRPWNAALNISNSAVMRAGYDPLSSVDAQIEKKFSARGIKPNGFETARQQITIFADMAPEEELSFLRGTLEEYRNAPTEVEKLVTYWAAGDVAKLNSLFISEAKSEGGSFYDQLFTNRNRAWTTKIEEMLAGKGVIFIAVGAGHLVGDDSVVAMLTASGFKVERYQ